MDRLGRLRGIASSPVSSLSVAVILSAVVMLFQLSLATAVIGIPLLVFFPAIAVGAFLGGIVCGGLVAAAGIVTAASLLFAPPWNFTLGYSLYGYMMFIAFVASTAVLLAVIAGSPAQVVISQASTAIPPRQPPVPLEGALDWWLQRNLSMFVRLLRLYRREAIPAESLAAVGLEERLGAIRRIHKSIGSVAVRNDSPDRVIERLCRDILEDSPQADIEFALSVSRTFRPVAGKEGNTYLILAEALVELAHKTAKGATIHIDAGDDGTRFLVAMYIEGPLASRDERLLFLETTSATICKKLARAIDAEFLQPSETERVLVMPLPADTGDIPDDRQQSAEALRFIETFPFPEGDEMPDDRPKGSAPPRGP